MTIKPFDFGTANARYLVTAEIGPWHVSCWCHLDSHGLYWLGKPGDSTLRRLQCLAAYKTFGRIYNPSLATKARLWAALETLLNRSPEPERRSPANVRTQENPMPKKKIETRTVKDQLADEQKRVAATNQEIARLASTTSSSPAATSVSHDFVDGKLPAPGAPAPAATIARSTSAVFEPTPAEPAVRVVSLEESKSWKRLDMNKPHPHAAKFGWIKDTNGVWVKPPATSTN